MQKVMNSPFLLGRDIGIIALNETGLKEMLGITVFADQLQTKRRTGKTPVEISADNKRLPLRVIRRKSF